MGEKLVTFVNSEFGDLLIVHFSTFTLINTYKNIVIKYFDTIYCCFHISFFNLGILYAFLDSQFFYIYKIIGIAENEFITSVLCSNISVYSESRKEFLIEVKILTYIQSVIISINLSASKCNIDKYFIFI